jgi:FtsH-binding integral membrane protein
MYATSSIFNTLFGVKTFMKGGSSFEELVKSKQSFLFKTFLNLMIQLAITYFVMTNTHLPINKWISIVCIFVIIFIIAIIPMPKWIKFILFSIFSFFNGVLLSDDIQGIDKSTIQFAVIGTAAIFVSMILAGIILLLFGIKLGFYTFVLLFFALFASIIATILQFYITSINQLWLSNFIIGLFAIFIIYDTQNILKRNYHGDFITASMDYYLDIINIFIRLLKR